MPYVVTTKRLDACTCLIARPDWPHASGCPGVSQVAVATLEEARTKVTGLALADAVIANDYEKLRRQFDAVRESGGTVGPLPDGTVIDVSLVAWRFIYREIGWFEPPSGLKPEVSARDRDRALTTFNAKREVDNG